MGIRHREGGQCVKSQEPLCHEEDARTPLVVTASQPMRKTRKREHFSFFPFETWSHVVPAGLELCSQGRS